MGSDIYTESAVAVRFDDFLNRKELDENYIRNGIVNDLIDNDIVIEGLTEKLMMRDSKTALVGKLVDLICMSEKDTRMIVSVTLKSSQSFVKTSVLILIIYQNVILMW